jgi:prepilin-type N-terminal cleavage/methylation domain-containing protein
MMPILKAGILSEPGGMCGPGRRMAPKAPSFVRGFTFVEVIIALAIASISVLALTRLHLVSIGMADTAQANCRAVLLAREKIAETLALGYPDEGVKSGTFRDGSLPLHWRTSVADLRLPQILESDISGLRKVSVDVTWERGSHEKRVQMSTYVADRKLR